MCGASDHMTTQTQPRHGGAFLAAAPFKKSPAGERGCSYSEMLDQLLDHPVGPREHVRRNGEAEHIRAALLPEPCFQQA